MNSIFTFVTKDMILAPGYPSSIQIPHALAAAYQFRTSFTPQEFSRVTFWHKIIGGYFCNGYGGTILRDALLGRSISILSHATILPHFIAYGVLLVNYSPHDIIFEALSTPLHPLRLLSIAGDAVDSTTTILGSYELAVQLYPSLTMAPWVAGFSTMVGGSIFRWFELRTREDACLSDIKTEWCHPTGGVQSGVVYIILYYYMRRSYGVRFARLWVTLLNVMIKIIKDVGPHLLNEDESWSKFHPAIWVYNQVTKLLTKVCTTFHLGPPPVEDEEFI
jgi:hypothetical protein